MQYEDATVHIEVSRDDYNAWDGRTVYDEDDINRQNQRLGEVIHREVSKGLSAINERTKAGHIARAKHIEITLRDAPVTATLTSTDPHVP